ncbi:unnamed protein product [Cryptosporidium hominis]|uniref:Uncharacterized protein n=1 Tax=Cryptosporidium hominis TaxID=237895 RepID=A0A0S4TIS4_CRYHO|nr:hypothetical protein [Cryptosporidium hominis TU502]OLQ17793.1 hypothetical protein ChTU502y2012_407g0605 [Cryptosporidium hominis]PPA64246.1 hypothetical protein ChUKH1_05530 [Cryptosporidium hominis]PPS94890.1 Uncharacterized protein GY17_00001911 [Cryptosporidium hominis]CUV07100.1 unnamed protein product [Cryptosporidium hominis]|eukprot:PPS94890.1 Uncharacterized protein GY17_00001911 [Cryptosporidium hominis]
MNSYKHIFCHILPLLLFIILAIPFNSNVPSHGKSIQYKHSFAKIRDDYTRLDIERGSDLVRKSREALQVSIFTYFMAQKKLAEMRILGAHPNSNEYRIAEDYYRYALNSMKMAKDDWENNLKSAPIFTYRKDHITNYKTRGANNYDLNSLFLLTGRDYSGERGIDFQIDTYEDSEPVYLPIPTQKKLNKEIINNLNLGFKFSDLPFKLTKSINDRENNKKQNRLGNKGRQIKNSYKNIPALENLSYNNKLSSEFFSFEKLIGNNKDDDSLRSVDKYIDDISPTNQFSTPDFIKSKEFLDIKSANNQNLMSKSLKSYEMPIKQNKDENLKRRRSRGVLDREPEIPTDVSIQIERKLGGPLKFIDLSLKDLNKDIDLKIIFMQYIKSTLRCIQLYESKSVFEELFHCSKNQLDLSFKLLQKLADLKINYNYHKNDSTYIKKKFNINYVDWPESTDKTEENEEFFNHLVSCGIFHSNTTNTTNTSNTTNNNIIDNRIKYFNDRPDPEIYSEDISTFDYKPGYLDRFMDRYGFTEDEYIANKRLTRAVNHLAALEAEFINRTENNERVEHNKIYDYKMLTDFIPIEILNWRARRPLFNETEKN